MDRKSFLRKTALATGGVALGTPLMYGCGKNGGLIGGSEDKDPWESLEILVDNAYNKPDYSAAKDVTNDSGFVSFHDMYDDEIFVKFFTEGFSGGEAPGLDINFFREYRYGNKGFLLASDPQGRYMPKLISIPDNSSRFSLVKRLENADLRMNTNTGYFSWNFQKAKQSDFNLFIDEIKDSIPIWDLKDFDDLPGYLYLGDSSFDNLKNLNTILKNAFAGATLLFPNPATASAYSVFETNGKILEVVDEAIDMINKFRERKDLDLIDKHQRYSIYTPLLNGPKLVFFPSSMSDKDSEVDVRDLFPINEGNSWTYNYGRHNLTLRVTGKRRVKGEYLAVVENINGLEEYFGFKGNSLNYYGFNFPELGNVFFDPALEFGDNKIKKGRNFRTESKIVFEDQSDITGKVVENYNYVDTENVLLRSGRPFGDCLKVQENFSMNLDRNGDRISEDFQATRWLAKNLGPVRVNVDGENIELVDSNIKSRMEGFTFLKEINSKFENNFPSIPRKIIDAYKRIS
ncbi:MAG: hypothetical protein WDZ62_00180 [Candidatus Pacearchaeota archaeon]